MALAGGEEIGGAAVGTLATSDPSGAIGPQVYAQPGRIAGAHVCPVPATILRADHPVLEAALREPSCRGAVLFIAKAHLVQARVPGADLYGFPRGAEVQGAVHARLAYEQAHAAGMQVRAQQVQQVEGLRVPRLAGIGAAQQGAPGAHGQYRVARHVHAQQAVRGGAGGLGPGIAAIGGADDVAADPHTDAILGIEEVQRPDADSRRGRQGRPRGAGILGAQQHVAGGRGEPQLIVHEVQGHDRVGGAAGLLGPTGAAVRGHQDLAGLTAGPAQGVVHEVHARHVAPHRLEHGGQILPAIVRQVEAPAVGRDDAAVLVPHVQHAGLVGHVEGEALPAPAGVGGLQHETQHPVDHVACGGTGQLHRGQFAAGLHGRHQFPFLG